MLVSYERNFLFVHIPKTAGTSIRNSLSAYAVCPESFWENRLLTRFGIHVNTVGPWHRKWFRPHCSADDIRRHLPADVYNRLFKFAFVRNPWDLLVSLYNFIPSRPTHRHRKRVADMSFADFVDEWTRRPEILQAPRIRDRQGRLIVDFVGCFENVSLDFKVICSRIGITVTLPCHNRSRHDDYRSSYTEPLKQLVAERLAEDIEFLGYTFDGVTDSPCRTASAAVKSAERSAA
ncbi:MAG: sulfotransferase family 2 domain-containing protein [Planctomycetaceae bacterium]|nr:sulfotransferase family 2 domain-containing protein [Planctomycetaceae bacterium]